MKDINIVTWCVFIIVMMFAVDWLVMKNVHDCTAFSDSTFESTCGDRWAK
ncbi:MAG: hypothetical protein ACXW11_12360 [Methylotenera sp.]